MHPAHLEILAGRVPQPACVPGPTPRRRREPGRLRVAVARVLVHVAERLVPPVPTVPRSVELRVGQVRA